MTHTAFTEDVPTAATSQVAARALAATKVYGRGDQAVTALDAVDVEIPRGRFTAVMGPSGSGKSTLMHCLAGLDRPTHGTVSVDGVELTSLDDDRLTRFRRDHLGFVFQAFNLLPMLTARQNIVLPFELAGRRIDANVQDDIDTVVGLLAENPPAGFGFSDTAFRVFLLMASRRLQSDRFLTVDFRPEIYTPLGMDWIERSGLSTVLLRHCPELAGCLDLIILT